jgi:hypothetical protein
MIRIASSIFVVLFALACSSPSTGEGEGEAAEGEGEGEGEEGEGEEGEGEEGEGEEGEGEPALLPDPTTVELNGRCPDATRVGQFTVEAQERFGVVQGSVNDGIVPTSVPDIVSDDGSCRLLRRRTLSCNPVCQAGQTCGDDGNCIPFPRQQSVGTVTIEGLVAAVSMEPRVPGNGYFAPSANNPPYVVDETVRLTAAGADGQTGFVLHGVGGEPLTEAPNWVLAAGQPFALTWPAPVGPINRSSVQVEMTIDQHGLSPLSLRCTFPDTGAATIASATIDQLINSGVTGFPNGKLTRLTADSVDGSDGCIELLVGSPIAPNVSVAGETPCNSTADCPDGQICDVPNQRCD